MLCLPRGQWRRLLSSQPWFLQHTGSSFTLTTGGDGRLYDVCNGVSSTVSAPSAKSWVARNFAEEAVPLSIWMGCLAVQIPAAMAVHFQNPEQDLPARTLAATVVASWAQRLRLRDVIVWLRGPWRWPWWPVSLKLSLLRGRQTPQRIWRFHQWYEARAYLKDIDSLAKRPVRITVFW